ncbi:MAG: Gfo/Idh/MocA family oxidoreductase, partial [Armatimonadota bacterium]
MGTRKEMGMLKVGLVGLPRARSFAAAFRTQPGVEIVAGCDINPETLQRISDDLGIGKRFTDYEAFLDSGVDIVVIGTPMPFH